jgi:DNA-directed RNA polymerase specialized sigma24 family protein
MDSGAEMDVASLLAQLPGDYRQVLTLFYLEQKAYEEVAAMLGLPLGTVKTLIFRAKKALVRINAWQEQAGAMGLKGLPPTGPLTKINLL